MIRIVIELGMIRIVIELGKIREHLQSDVANNDLLLRQEVRGIFEALCRVHDDLAP
jgi:hypothetical protein